MGEFDFLASVFVFRSTKHQQVGQKICKQVLMVDNTKHAQVATGFFCLLNSEGSSGAIQFFFPL